MNGKENDLKRLQKMILKEELRLPSNVIEILKAELYETLDSFFGVLEDKCYLSVTMREKDRYEILLHAEAVGVKNVRATGIGG